MHCSNAYPINALCSTVGLYDRVHSQAALGILKNCGRRNLPVEGASISPDGQWAPRSVLHPTLLFEVAVHQSAPTLLMKVQAILRHSKSSIVVVALKIWQDPLPENIVAIAAVWRKKDCTVQEIDPQAAHFVSFGNRAPSPSQLAEFQPMAGHGLSVPLLVGVTGGPTNTPSTEDNMSLPVFRLSVPARALFAVPETGVPNPNASLPDLVIELSRLKACIVEGIIDDILINAYKLSDAHIQEIVSNDNIRASYRELHNFAVTRLEETKGRGV